MRLALKIDVDTLVGFREGVPALLRVLAARGITASFFVAMGPDHSGRAIRRLFTHKGFWQKMRRTGAPRLYGLKTMLYGTVLPGPAIAASAPDLLRRIAAAGHELGLHGFDHVFWQDRLGHLSAAAIRAEIRRAQEVHQQILGYRALSFAAPGWQCTPAALTALAAERFYYISNTRGQNPYFPAENGRLWPLLEIPTTLPTMDELLGLDGRRPGDFNREIIAALRPGHTHVLTIHAEVEGRGYLQDFTALLAEAQAQGVSWLRLIDYATELWQQWQHLPRQGMAPGTLPGRAGTVTCQVTRETPP